jgi:hypothetical protein
MTTIVNKYFRTTVNGAKELKQYIQDMNNLIQSIRSEFQNDLKQPRACVEEPKTFLGSRKFDVTMCKVSHDCYVYSQSVLPQESTFIQTEQVVLDHLKELEHLRKMIITNKQQKKTAIRYIRRIQSSLRERSQLVQANTDVNEPFECLLEYENHEIENLNQLIGILKQNYRTNARKLCEQAHQTLIVLRTRDILAYKIASENTIGAIIHHAEKCRTFITQCRFIACIEYCAHTWWMDTQKDPMDHSSYCVTAISEGEPIRYSGDVTTVKNQRIKIDIRSYDNNSIVFTEYLNQDLAEIILTEEAIYAFESDENYESTSNIIHPEYENDNDDNGSSYDYYSD